MLWLQSVASFAEDQSRIKGTAFLDRAASLCPFLAVPPVCRACLDSGSVCLTVLQCWQTEQVVHFVGVATFICFSCPLPYFLSYLLLSLLYFSIIFWAISLAPVSLLPRLILPSNPLYVSPWLLSAAGSCCFHLFDDKRKHSRCEQLSPSQISVLLTRPVQSRHEAWWFKPISGTSAGLLLKIRSASVSLIDNVVVVSLVSMQSSCPVAQIW